VESVAKQVDVEGLVSLAGERGFLTTHKRLSDLSGGGPVVMVAGATGFTPWSRDSIELLRSAGAQVRRLDLLDDDALAPEACGLVIAGTLWPETIQDISMNTPLLRDIAERVAGGLPTIALGGGMLVMLNALQDTLGRTSELAGVIPAEGEILWDLEDPAYVEVRATRDNVLLTKGERLTGWVTSEVELNRVSTDWEAPVLVRGAGAIGERRESYGGDTLLCCPALIHLGASRGAATRFVKQCQDFESSVVQ
jgi:cobyrinic acid a,c-diamide synthase